MGRRRRRGRAGRRSLCRHRCRCRAGRRPGREPAGSHRDTGRAGHCRRSDPRAAAAARSRRHRRPAAGRAARSGRAPLLAARTPVVAKGSLAVVAGHIWAAGFGERGAVLFQVDPRTLRPLGHSPVEAETGPGCADRRVRAAGLPRPQRRRPATSCGASTAGPAPVRQTWPDVAGAASARPEREPGPRVYTVDVRIRPGPAPRRRLPRLTWARRRPGRMMDGMIQALRRGSADEVLAFGARRRVPPRAWRGLAALAAVARARGRRHRRAAAAGGGRARLGRRAGAGPLPVAAGPARGGRFDGARLLPP